MVNKYFLTSKLKGTLTKSTDKGNILKISA